MAKGNRQVKSASSLRREGSIARIMVATDLSPVGNRAVEYARMLAEGLGASVFVVHVVPPVLQVEGVDAAAVARQGEAWARQRLANIDVDPSCITIVHGPVVDSIAKEARRRRADVVVVGSRGLGGWKKWVLGSVAQSLLQSAPCPVLIVPKGIRLPRTRAVRGRRGASK
jgi:nucleotide-binding universal stress UspA family protein